MAAQRIARSWLFAHVHAIQLVTRLLRPSLSMRTIAIRAILPSGSARSAVLDVCADRDVAAGHAVGGWRCPRTAAARQVDTTTARGETGPGPRAPLAGTLVCGRADPVNDQGGSFHAQVSGHRGSG